MSTADHKGSVMVTYLAQGNEDPHESLEIHHPYPMKEYPDLFMRFYPDGHYDMKFTIIKEDGDKDTTQVTSVNTLGETMWKIEKAPKKNN